MKYDWSTQRIDDPEFLAVVTLSFTALVVVYVITRAYVHSVVKQYRLRKAYESTEQEFELMRIISQPLERPSAVVPKRPRIAMPMPEGVRRQAMKTLTGLGDGGWKATGRKTISAKTRGGAYAYPPSQSSPCLSDSDSFQVINNAINSALADAPSTPSFHGDGGSSGGAGASGSWDCGTSSDTSSSTVTGCD